MERYDIVFTMSNNKDRLYGYTILKRITDNTRFSTYQVELSGKNYFLKCAKPDVTRNLANDVWWSLTLNRLVEGKEDIGLRAPNVVESHEDWAVFEWIDGNELAKPEASDEELQKIASYLAKVLYGLDSAIHINIGKHPYVEKSETAPYTLLTTKWPLWTKEPLTQGFISDSDIRAAQDLVTKLSGNVLAGLSHGDFSPWHIIATPQERILIDGDHSSIIKPRYYDLAYIYSRLFSRNRSRLATSQLLREFVEHSGVSPTDFASAFLPVLTSRAIGVCNDAAHDLPANHDYRDSAAELLQICIKQDLSSLLG